MPLKLFQNIQSPHIKKYAINTSWLFADNFIRQAVNIIVGVFMARYLKPEGLGSISYATAYMQLLTPLALLGLNAIAIKEFVSNKVNAGTIVATTFYLKLVAAVAAYLILALTAFVVEPDPQMRVYILIIGLSFLLTPLQVAEYYFQANLKSKYNVVALQIATGVCALLKIVGMLNGYSVGYFIWLVLIEVIISSTCLIAIFKRKSGVRFAQFDGQVAKQMLQESFPIIFTGFFIIIYMRLDQLMIQKLLNTESLGIFSAATKLSEAFYVIPGIVVGSLFPAIINGMKISREEYLSRIQRLYAVLSLLCFCAIAFVFVFGDLLISTLYGAAFDQSASVLKVHFCTSLFVFMGTAYSQAFIAEGLQRATTINTVVGAVLNIVLNLLLIPRIGVIGSAVATLVAQIYSGFLALLLTPQTRVHFFLILKSFNIVTTIKVYLKKFAALNHE